MFERIVIPLDGSRLASRALPFAVSIAKKFNSELMLMRVVSRTQNGYISESAGLGTPGNMDFIAEQIHSRDVENMAHAKRYLVNRANLLNHAGLDVTYHVLEGLPARSIIDFSDAQKASLIVMMSHGRGWLKRTILGSVTDAVVHGSHVPVLVVRNNGNSGFSHLNEKGVT